MTDRDKEIALKYLHDNNKCASVSAKGAYCTITANHVGRKHKAQVLGGVNDGKLIEEWDW